MLKKLFTITAIATSCICFGQRISVNQHSLFLCPDGSVKSWGRNILGQLGSGDHVNKYLPQNISNLSDVVAVAAGFSHSLFLKNDSTVWACGSNSDGALGYGNTTQQTTPVQVNGLSGIKAIAAGNSFSLFLKSNGTVWACGYNYYGQLGNGNTTQQTTPVQVNGLSGITAIAAGGAHSLFLKSDGTVFACGYNSYGELGNGEHTDDPSPTLTQISGLTGVIAIEAGQYSSLFLKSDGTVWGCGYNINGQLAEVNPVPVNGLSGITAMAADWHFLFLKSDGTVLGFGNNDYGQLGPGGYITNTPVAITGLTGITAIEAGNKCSMFLKNDGTILSCGYNQFGQLGNGNTTAQTILVNIGNACIQPTPPTVDMSNFPTSVCLGSNVSVNPTIGGSNPVGLFTVDNSIQLNNPKAIAKNKNSVFVLNDNDAIARFGFDGNLLSNYPSLSISGIQAFTADDSSNIYLFNGDGHIYKCDSTGALVNTLSVLWPSSAANQLAFTQPVNPNVHPENLFLIDPQQTSGALITGINTYDNNHFTNSDLYPTNSTYVPWATSLSIDGFYSNKRVLMADPVNSTLRSRILYPDGSPNFDYKEGYLVDSALTAGMNFDFIDSHLDFNLFAVSSKTTGILGWGLRIKSPDGTEIGYLDTNITHQIHPMQPVGIVTTKFGSSLQFWIADRGANRILRALPSSYQISPALPEGLTYDGSTGKVSGTPTTVTSPQTYTVIMTTPYGSDTTHFTLSVTPTSGPGNTTGTSTSEGQQDDGLTIKYYNANNCEKMIDIADSLGGTSPGNTTVSQTVYPIVSVVANDSLIRRATQIKAENIDTLQVNVTFYYTYDDIQLYKQSTGSTLSNDTTGGTMQIAVLQMHDLENGGKEPIIHSPITANWSHTGHYWKAVVPVTKFSEFYAGDTARLSHFHCNNTGDTALTVSNAYYVWNNDTLYTGGDYIDTLINHTGCDSITTLHLSLLTTGISDAATVSGIHIFPNPSNGLFNIKFENNTTEPKQVRVTNILGTEVYNTIIRGSSSLDLSNQNNGIYFISVETDKGTPMVWRVIKE